MRRESRRNDGDDGDGEDEDADDPEDEHGGVPDAVVECIGDGVDDLHGCGGGCFDHEVFASPVTSERL